MNNIRVLTSEEKLANVYSFNLREFEEFKKLNPPNGWIVYAGQDQESKVWTTLVSEIVLVKKSKRKMMEHLEPESAWEFVEYSLTYASASCTPRYIRSRNLNKFTKLEHPSSWYQYIGVFNDHDTAKTMIKEFTDKEAARLREIANNLNKFADNF